MSTTSTEERDPWSPNDWDRTPSPYRARQDWYKELKENEDNQYWYKAEEDWYYTKLQGGDIPDNCHEVIIMLCKAYFGKLTKP